MATSFLIGDVVTENSRAKFHHVVQLAWYPHDSRNAELAGSYLWTNQSIGSELPSVQALRRLCDNYEYPKPESTKPTEPTNCHTWIATYGHGKSHLALALANFFGQSADSDVVREILENVKHAQSDLGQRLEAFKQGHKPYLVLRLRGDQPGTLSQLMVAGLEQALAEQPGIEDRNLRLWFEPALNQLEGFDAAQRAKADAYLAASGLDLAQLVADLRARDNARYDLTRNLMEHVTRVLPDYGSQLTPRQLLEYVAKTFCDRNPDSGKPCAGVLVLFDEFGRFVEDYAASYDVKSAGVPLQNLLEAVDHLRGLAAFVGLTQYRPELIATKKMKARGAAMESLDDIRKELNRLPPNLHQHLASPLEAVLDGYLNQDEAKWQELTADDETWDQLTDTVNLVPLLFPKRYVADYEGKGWTQDKLIETLGKGCFPLHPLTTALLCGANLRAGDAARSVLSFVQVKVREASDKPARTVEGLNWIRPIELVEYFKESLALDELAWQRYEEARRKAPATSAVRDVLAAMFLFETAGFAVGATPADDYAGVIAALAGQTREQAEATLTELVADIYIEYDATQKKYLFWNQGQHGADAAKQLNDQLAKKWNQRSDVQELLPELLESLALPKPVMFGNPDVWKAKKLCVSRAQWTPPYLASLLAPISYDQSKRQLVDACRGYVLLPIALDDEDLTWFQTNANKVFQDALRAVSEKTPPPAIVLMPQEPQEALVKSRLALHLFEGWGNDTRVALGEQALQTLKKRLEDDVQRTKSALWAGDTQLKAWYCPAVYEAGVKARLGGQANPSLDKVLMECYYVAYHAAAPFTDEAQRTSFKQGVSRACKFLITGTFDGWSSPVDAPPKADHLYNAFLRVSPKKTAWGVVDHRDKVREPAADTVQAAWKRLDEAVPVGAVRASLRPVLLGLLNAPYGYDYYALGLLLCAWIGANRHHAKLFAGPAGGFFGVKTWLDSNNDFSTLFATFLNADVRVSRSDPGAGKNEITELIKDVHEHKTLTYTQAQDAAQTLLTYAEEEAADDLIRPQAREAATLLAKDQELTDKYRKDLEDISARVANGSFPQTITGVRNVVDLLGKVRQQPELGCVQLPDPELVARVEEQVLSKLRSTVSLACSVFESLSNSERYEGQADSIRQIEEAVGSLDEPSLARIELAKANLSRLRQEKRDEEHDKGLVKRLREVEKLRSLAEIRVALPEIEAFAPKLETNVPLRDQVIEKLAQRQADLLHEAQTLVAQADEVATTTEVKSLKARVQKIQGSYVGATPEAEQLAEVLDRCGLLHSVFERVEEYAVEEVSDAKQLNNLLRKYETQAGKPGLSAFQRERVQFAQAQRSAAFEKQIKDAAELLDSLHTQFGQGESAAVVMEKLTEGRGGTLRFLATTEQTTKLRTLESKLKTRIEGDDLELIQKKFLAFDQKKRAACLTKLQALLATPQVLEEAPDGRANGVAATA